MLLLQRTRVWFAAPVMPSQKMITEEARRAQDFTLPYPTKPSLLGGMNLPSVPFTCLLLASANLASSFLYLLPYSCFPTETSQLPSSTAPLQRSKRAAGITLLWLCCCPSFCLLTSCLGFRSHTNNNRELK